MASHNDKAESLVRVAALCRGEGVCYVLLTGSRDIGGLTARANTKGGRTLPCVVHAVTSPALLGQLAPSSPTAWVVVLPQLSCDVVVEIVHGADALLTVPFPALQSKFSSRMLTMTKPQAAAVLRGYEHRYARGGMQVTIAEVWPAEGDEVVWRVRVSYPMDNVDLRPILGVFDTKAREVGVDPIVMEDQVVPSPRDSARSVRLTTFSFRMSQEVMGFYVVAGIEGMESLSGFDGINVPRARGMLNWTRTFEAGAAGNPNYARWFEESRATGAELDWQRQACASLSQKDHPLLSLVMPVYQTPSTFLREALGSVVAQSYDRWELVVINASGPCAGVDRVLASFADPRIRVIEVPNRSISENTNEGIAAATGDYVGFVDHDDVLEPDALWWLANAIASNPHIDLLYTDEDHLGKDGLHDPAFKTFPNYGKLYQHNYVTHLLMVSRWTLEHTERSGAEVAGAQDYDLTLKAFEVARNIVHVPRVLYHWREHAGSTAGGGDQKPFAHAAGARALQAHLDRRGIAAHVEDGLLPYTYRVRYALPDPAPKVSIVIPTRDQATLLRTCVESILHKSTYKNFEIVLVENNSEEDCTFALYEELVAAHDCVRVVVWRPEQPGTFNYSKLVNFGVAHSTGELVVLLNNDTEVIEPAWLEEMAGCLMRPEVGVVGAKLLFGDGLIQHVGMVGNPEGNFSHVCQNLTRDALGSGYAAAMPGDYSMVTGACQMVSRSLYDELGGYDEDLAVGFNDGDFCLRARDAGYAVTVCEHALLHHREFSTRGREQTDKRLRARYLKERALMMSKHAEFFAQGDPALNPNLDPFGTYFDIPAMHE